MERQLPAFILQKSVLKFFTLLVHTSEFLADTQPFINAKRVKLIASDKLDSSDTFRFYILFISSSISSSEKLSGSTFAI